jgi:hypothetical protein
LRFTIFPIDIDGTANFSPGKVSDLGEWKVFILLGKSSNFPIELHHEERWREAGLLHYSTLNNTI